MKKLLSTFVLITSTVFYSQTAITDTNFKDAIKDCLSTNPVDGMCINSKYGSMPDWDVSRVTDMSRAFKDRTNFNGDISEWDVSSVTNMEFMFYEASSFNQNINSKKVTVDGETYTAWDVSKVKNMEYMFYKASSFDQPLHNWDVRKVKNMKDLLNKSGLSVSNYDKILIGWSGQDVEPNVELGAYGINYCNASAARQSLIDDKQWKINDRQKCPITNADFRKAIIDCLQKDSNGKCTASKYGPMRYWDVSQVTDMSYAFNDKIDFNGDISNWNVSNVTNMRFMFGDAKAFNQNINTKEVTTVNGKTYTAWDVSKVKDMYGIFYKAEKFNQPLHNWDVSNVEDMGPMFYEASSFNQNINTKEVTVNGVSYTAWDVSNVTDMHYMFLKLKNSINLYISGM